MDGLSTCHGGHDPAIDARFHLRTQYTAKTGYPGLPLPRVRHHPCAIFPGGRSNGNRHGGRTPPSRMLPKTAKRKTAGPAPTPLRYIKRKKGTPPFGVPFCVFYAIIKIFCVFRRLTSFSCGACRSFPALYQFGNLPLQSLDDLLFKTRNVALRNSKLVGNILLRHLLLSAKPEPHIHDPPLPLRELFQCLLQ